MERVDILINNAGYLLKKPFEEITATDWNRVLGSIFGTGTPCTAPAPYLKGASGRTSSILAAWAATRQC